MEDIDGNQIMPITTAENVYVDESTTLDTKLKELDSGGGSGGSSAWIYSGVALQCDDDPYTVPSTANEMLILWENENNAQVVHKTFVLPYGTTTYPSDESGTSLCNITSVGVITPNPNLEGYLEIYYR